MTEMYYGKDRNALRQGQKCIMALTEMYYAKKRETYYAKDRNV